METEIFDANASAATAENVSPQAQWRARDIARPPRLGLNSGLLMVGMAAIMILLGFLPLYLPPLMSWLAYAMSNSPTVPVPEPIAYNVQLPWILLVGAVLGPWLGLGAWGVFGLVGLFLLPTFAGGGGVGYLAQPSAGYLLGMGVGTFVAGYLNDRLRLLGLSTTTPEEAFSTRLLYAMPLALISVLVVHGMGSIFLIPLTLFTPLTASEALQWWFSLSWTPLPYDVLVSWLLLSQARNLRAALWMFIY